MRTIYVVTHPEATHHVERVVGGWHESTLTPSGELTAASIGAELRARIPAGAGIDLFSSDLQRAEQTARIVAACLQAEPVLDQRLREKSYGEAEGKPQAWLDARFRPPPVTGDRMNHDAGVGGAETKKGVRMSDLRRHGRHPPERLRAPGCHHARLRRHVHRGLVDQDADCIARLRELPGRRRQHHRATAKTTTFTIARLRVSARRIICARNKTR